MTLLAPQTPIVRRNDPESSKAVAREITESGLRTRQQAEVLRLVRAYPNSTSLELAQHGSLDRYAIARRLPELEQAGLVKRGEMRRCSVGARPALTWEACEGHE
jgi:DNA-binding MarR family transcriptional regulator